MATRARFSFGRPDAALRERTSPNANPQHLLIFDGVCALCHGLVRWTLRRDRQGVFHFAPLQGKTAATTLRRHPQLDGVDSVVVVLARGSGAESVFVRSDAVIATGIALGGPWRALARAGRLVPKTWRDRLYDFVARRRYRTFGRYEECPLPPASARPRFLD